MCKCVRESSEFRFFFCFIVLPRYFWLPIIWCKRNRHNIAQRSILIPNTHRMATQRFWEHRKSHHTNNEERNCNVIVVYVPRIHRQFCSLFDSTTTTTTTTYLSSSIGGRMDVRSHIRVLYVCAVSVWVVSERKPLKRVASSRQTVYTRKTMWSNPNSVCNVHHFTILWLFCFFLRRNP